MFFVFLVLMYKNPTLNNDPEVTSSMCLFLNAMFHRQKWAIIKGYKYYPNQLQGWWKAVIFIIVNWMPHYFFKLHKN